MNRKAQFGGCKLIRTPIKKITERQDKGYEICGKLPELPSKGSDGEVVEGGGIQETEAARFGADWN